MVIGLPIIFRPCTQDCNQSLKQILVLFLHKKLSVISLCVCLMRLIGGTVDWLVRQNFLKSPCSPFFGGIVLTVNTAKVTEQNRTIIITEGMIHLMVMDYRHRRANVFKMLFF